MSSQERSGVKKSNKKEISQVESHQKSKLSVPDAIKNLHKIQEFT